MCFTVVLIAGYDNSVLAQDRTVSGKVTDPTGSSLPGVSVMIKGTTVGTQTDVEGRYTLSVPNGGVLTFSFIGYETKEVPIGNLSILDVSLSEDSKTLEEIVVQGYTTTSETQRVAAVSKVGSSAIENVPMPDVNQILQGRAPGVFSTAPSGQPGAAQQVLIRGVGSLTAGNGPLYVLDGVIMQTGDFTSETQTNDILANINPNDIESVNVLKDAAGTALYGARGSNGVILITTKRGKSGTSQVIARAQYGVTQPLFGKFDLMNPREAWDYERQALTNAGSTPTQLDTQRPASLLDNTFDWVDAAFRTGKTTNYELQASGGDNKTRFFLSGGVFSQDGTLIESSFKRYSARTNIDHNVTDKLDVSVNLNVSYTDQLNAVAGNRFASPIIGSFLTTPLQSAYDPETGKLFTGREGSYIGFTGDNFLYSAPLNPVVNNNLRTVGKLSVGYNILSNIRASQNVNIDFLNINEKAFFDPTTNDGFDVTGEIDEANAQSIVVTSQTQLTGNWTIGSKHNIDALVVYEFQRSETSNFQAYGTGLASGELKTLNSTAVPLGVGGTDTQYAFESYLAQANYNYDNKYYLTGSFRRDGSSRFGANNRYANFWSLGASWRLIEEEFIKGIEVLSDLKLRASYGVTGNASIGNFESKGLYSFGAAYQGVPGSTPTTIDNPSLTWEVGKTLNIGLDAGVFRNRLTASVEVYRRVTEDLLQNVPISATSGFTTALRNVGSIENKGVEAVVSTVNIAKGPIRWTTDFNFSYNKNEILALYNGQETAGAITLLREGEAMNTFYLRRWAGVNPADGTPLWRTADGGVTGNYSAAAQFVAGKAQPDFIGGLNNTVSYKGLSLSFFFYAALGHEIYNQSRQYIESDGAQMGVNHIADYVGNYWTTPGQIAKYPQPKSGGNNSSNSISTRYLEDGSFLRLRNVVLGYTLPKNVVSKAYMKNARIYIQGQNLLTVTKYSGYDPEALLSGNEFFRYPVGKSYTAGVEITF